ncbi:MAG: hypothetical protein ACRD1V_20685, partial [Vicinamibacterales bacterium]
MSPLILVILVFLMGAGLVVGAYLGVTKLPGYLAQKHLDTRIDELVMPPPSETADGHDLVKTKHEGPLPVLDRFAAGTTRGSAIGAWLEQSGVR